MWPSLTKSVYAPGHSTLVQTGTGTLDTGAHLPLVAIARACYRYFLLFLLYTALCCCYAGTLLVARFISCTNNMRLCPITPLQTALCIINFVEALVFGLFCAIMMADQLNAIFDNTPGIDALQGKKGERRGRYSSLCTVMGEKIGWRWLLPVACHEQLRLEFDEELRLDGSHNTNAAASGGGSGAGARLAAGDGIERVGASIFPSLTASAMASGDNDSKDTAADEERKAHFERDDESSAGGGQTSGGQQGGIIGMIQSVYGDEVKEDSSHDGHGHSDHSSHHALEAHRRRSHGARKAE